MTFAFLLTESISSDLVINFCPCLCSGVAQVVCEGMDDTRVDLSQLEDPGTGRSVPTTPLQVSPQGRCGYRSIIRYHYFKSKGLIISHVLLFRRAQCQ